MNHHQLKRVNKGDDIFWWSIRVEKKTLVNDKQTGVEHLLTN